MCSFFIFFKIIEFRTRHLFIFGKKQAVYGEKNCIFFSFITNLYIFFIKYYNFSMKRIFFTITAFFIAANISAGGLSEFSPFYSGLGVEAGMNSYDRVSCSLKMENIFSLTDKVKAGCSVLFGTDFDTFNTLEFFAEGGYLFPENFAGGRIKFMAGAAAGYEQIWHGGEALHTATAGVEGKMFVTLTDFGRSKAVLVPCIRLGYPYLWSAGLSFGVMF